MGLFEAVIRALLWICGVVLLYFLVVYVLGALGIVIPANMLKVIMVMFFLIALLILARLFYPFFSSGPWFGGGPGAGPDRRF
jgi:hypothetical protein